MSAGSRTNWLGTLAGRLKRLVRLSPAFVVVGCLAWHAGSSLWVYPHSLAYFNEAAGGPANGHKHLLHSNLDWGQDLLYLREWAGTHREARPLRVATTSAVRPQVIGIPSSGRPPAKYGQLRQQLIAQRFFPAGEWHAVGFNLLYEPGNYKYLQTLRPISILGHTICIYRIRHDGPLTRPEGRTPPYCSVLEIRSGEVGPSGRLGAREIDTRAPSVWFTTEELIQLRLRRS